MRNLYGGRVALSATWIATFVLTQIFLQPVTFPLTKNLPAWPDHGDFTVLETGNHFVGIVKNFFNKESANNVVTHANGRHTPPPPNLQIAIVRLIGNNMPPLQARDQQRRNVRRIFEIEPRSTLVNANTSSTLFVPPITNDMDEGLKLEQLAVRLQYTAVQSFGDARENKVVHGDEVMYFVSRWNEEFWRLNPNTSSTVAMDPTVIDSSGSAVLPSGSSVLAKKWAEHRVTTVRSFVINRIIDAAEYDEIDSLLKSRGELRVEMPGSMEHLSKTNVRSLYYTNQNRARNVAINEMTLLGSTWITALDGNVAMTTEGYLGVTISAIMAEMMKSRYAFLPMYRLMNYDNDLVTSDASLEDIQDNLTRHEPQLSMRFDAPLLYDTSKPYGKRNKEDLLTYLFAQTDPLLAPTYCHEGYRRPSEGPVIKEPQYQIAHYCGWTIRLPWWPTETWCEAALTDNLSRIQARDHSYRILDQLTVASVKEFKRFNRRIDSIVNQEKAKDQQLKLV